MLESVSARENFDTEAGELIQCESDAAKKVLPLFGRQCEPSRIGV
jgi:hypothetical protein